MASYVELIRQDVCFHELGEDTSLWPSSVSWFVQSLRPALKLPRWLKSGPAPYTNKRALALIDQLRVSDDASNVELWDSVDTDIDKGMEQRLHVVFNAVLVDCARIQAVVETEILTDTPYPKETFLVLLVRDAILDAQPRLSLLEDVQVVLPRHFSGEEIPILNYMKKSFCVELITSVYQEMPLGQQFKDSDSASKTTETLGKTEEEQEDGFRSPRFEADFRASAKRSPLRHIPVLCMADEEHLPVSMSSLLYQRRVWHIDDPLIGLEFSKYETEVRLFVGWLEDSLPSDRVLPRVHLGEIETPVKLDLSSPSAALIFSRFVCGLDSHISAIRDSVRHSVDAVVKGTQSPSALSWRIDTDLRMKNSENNNAQDMTKQWVRSHQYSRSERSGPVASRSTPQQLTPT